VCWRVVSAGDTERDAIAYIPYDLSFLAQTD
jgi:hypothetical protein